MKEEKEENEREMKGACMKTGKEKSVTIDKKTEKHRGKMEKTKKNFLWTNS